MGKLVLRMAHGPGQGCPECPLSLGQLKPFVKTDPDFSTELTYPDKKRGYWVVGGRRPAMSLLVTYAGKCPPL